MKSCQLVHAEQEEEFFYVESDLPVLEGDPVGVDIEIENEVNFVLLDGIYWRGYEEEKI